MRIKVLAMYEETNVQFVTCNVKEKKLALSYFQ